MASTTAEELVVTIKAKLDQATRDVKAFEKQLDDLESEKVEVPITVDDGDAKRDLDAIFGLVDKMGATSARIVLQDNAKAIQQDISALLIDLDQLDAKDPEVQVKLDQLNQLEAELGQIDTKLAEVGSRPIDIETGRAKAGLDDIGNSADKSRSVLANMVGNATQDLGSLGGVAGSAGVAIGQMGEYMADALSGGSGLAAVLKSFGTVALPIAGISLGISLVSKLFESSKKHAEELAAATTKVVDALLDAQDAGEAASGALEDVADQALVDRLTKLGDVKLDKLASSMEELGLGWGDLVDAFATGEGPVADAIAEFENMDKILDNSIDITTGQQLYDAWALIAQGLGVTEEEAKKLYSTYGNLNTAIGDQLGVQQEALDKGGKLTDMRADYAAQQVKAADATDKAKKADEEAAKAAEEQAQKVEELAQAISDYLIQVTTANRAVLDLASAFSQMSLRADALSSVFDLGNAGLDMAGQVRDISLAIGDLSEAAKSIDLSKTLDASNVGADKLLDALDQLRPQIQQKVTEAFSTGGPEAATAMANSYIDQVVTELGGKLSREEVAQLLGLSDIEATVAVALELSSVEAAKRQLAILTGISGETPYTASIALALDAGTITGEQAQTLIQAQLGEAGVSVPSTLAAPATAEAVAAAQAALGNNPVEVPATADLSLADDEIDGWAHSVERAAPTEVPVSAPPDDAEDDIEGFRSGVERATPAQVKTDADTKRAIDTIKLLYILAQLLSPVVTVEANTGPAVSDLAALSRRTTRVPVDAYLDDYPSASEIQRAIGRPRIPVDIVVGSSIRITGVRD